MLTLFVPAVSISFVDAFLHNIVSFEYEDFFSVHGNSASSPFLAKNFWSPVWFPYTNHAPNKKEVIFRIVQGIKQKFVNERNESGIGKQNERKHEI